jgi:D-alanine--D-alanine ligase
MSKHVAVLMGGLSNERPVSLSTGKGCAEALRRAGYRVTELDVGYDVAERLREIAPDVAFNALHGPFGEDGTIQGVLEFLRIPYTHSGVLASALAMDKHQAKIMLKAAGIPVTDHVIASRSDVGRAHVMAPPYVVKPIADGSSFGVLIVKADQAHPPQEILGDDWKGGEELMVERYIPGRELTCAVWHCPSPRSSPISISTITRPNTPRVDHVTSCRQILNPKFTTKCKSLALLPMRLSAAVALRGRTSATMTRRVKMASLSVWRSTPSRA